MPTSGDGATLRRDGTTAVRFVLDPADQQLASRSLTIVRKGTTTRTRVRPLFLSPAPRQYGDGTALDFTHVLVLEDADSEAEPVHVRWPAPLNVPLFQGHAHAVLLRLEAGTCAMAGVSRVRVRLFALDWIVVRAPADQISAALRQDWARVLTGSALKALVDDRRWVAREGVPPLGPILAATSKKGAAAEGKDDGGEEGSDTSDSASAVSLGTDDEARTLETTGGYASDGDTVATAQSTVRQDPDEDKVTDDEVADGEVDDDEVLDVDDELSELEDGDMEDDGFDEGVYEEDF